MSDLLLYIGAFATAAGFGIALLTMFSSNEASVPVNQLLLDQEEDLRNAARELDLQRSLADRIFEPVARAFSARLRRVTPAGRLESIQEKLVLGGLENSRWKAEGVLAAKVVLTAVGSVFAVMVLSGGVTTRSVMLSGLAVGLGYLVPETLVTRRVEDRKKQIQQTLPDFIDQITVSVEAGLGFDGAMQRAGEEGKGILADEWLKVVNDLQIGMSRDEALEALVARTQVPDLRQFVLSIRQATRYGLPIARVLRVQSNEMREKRRARAEEKAMQIPVKITFPLVFFILPALFLVILGPAGIQISSGF